MGGGASKIASDEKINKSHNNAKVSGKKVSLSQVGAEIKAGDKDTVTSDATKQQIYASSLEQYLPAEIKYLQDVVAGRVQLRPDFVESLLGMISLGVSAVGSVAPVGQAGVAIAASVCSLLSAGSQSMRKQYAAQLAAAVYELPTSSIGPLAHAYAANMRVSDAWMLHQMNNPKQIPQLAAITVARSLHYVMRMEDPKITLENLEIGIPLGRSGGGVDQFLNTKFNSNDGVEYTAEGNGGRAGLVAVDPITKQSMFIAPDGKKRENNVKKYGYRRVPYRVVDALLSDPQNGYVTQDKPEAIWGVQGALFGAHTEWKHWDASQYQQVSAQTLQMGIDNILSFHDALIKQLEERLTKLEGTVKEQGAAIASQGSQITIMKEMLGQVDDRLTDVEEKLSSHAHETALWRQAFNACVKGSPKELESILKAYPKFHIADTRTVDGTPLIHLACDGGTYVLKKNKMDFATMKEINDFLEGQAECVRILLKYSRDPKALVDAKDESYYNITPLMSAAIYDALPAAKALVEAGANLFAVSSGKKETTAYDSAVFNNHEAIATYLKEKMLAQQAQKSVVTQPVPYPATASCHQASTEIGRPQGPAYSR